MNRAEVVAQINAHLRLYKDLGVRYLGTGPSAADRVATGAADNTVVPSIRPRPAPVTSFPPIAALDKGPVPVMAPPLVTTPALTRPPRAPEAPPPPLMPPHDSHTETLDDIVADMGNCQRCKLAPLRTRLVFGVGNPRAKLLFVGEGPGADEDAQGVPFVGRAGKLLTLIIESLGLERDEVYICNVVKCRPPGNRNPEPDEVAACAGFMERQIAAVRPRLIVALGTVAAHSLLRTTETIGKLRGRVFNYGDARLLATYHPSYLLRNPIEKRKVWDDMRMVIDCLRTLAQ